MSHDEEGWVAGIQQGDPTVLEQVVRECIPGLIRTATFAGLSREHAEDTVQETLLVFLRRKASFDGRVRVSTWIHGILLRKIWEARRDDRRSGREEEIEEVIESRFSATGAWSRPPEGPLEALERGEFRRELEACLGQLRDRQRVAFTLREIEGFSTEEICNILEVSANNLGVLLFRARNGLRECLEGRGFGGTDDASL